MIALQTINARLWFNTNLKLTTIEMVSHCFTLTYRYLTYNNGILHGQWIDANQSETELYQAIKKVLASSPIPDAEEWAIHDYESFGSISISEYEDIATISALANLIEEHGD